MFSQDDLPLSEAVPLLIKVLAKSMDTSLAVDKVELSTLSRDASGKVRRDLDTCPACPGISPGPVTLLVCSCHMCRSIALCSRSVLTDHSSIR